MSPLLVLLLLLYYGLHQDLWNWTATRPLFLGFIPPGLLYHALYTLGAAAIMALLVKRAWPRSLEIWSEEDSPK